MDIEQSTLIWITRIVFIIFAALIAYGSWRFMRRERIITLPARQTYTPPTHIELPEKNVSLNIMAKPGRVFDNEKLFEAMASIGFQYADNQVFEYFLPHSKYIAFSMINIRQPHIFPSPPHTMPPTNGMVAIMQLPVADGDNQVQHFHLMLSVLDELRTALDAELCDNKRNPLKNQQLYEMQKGIELFEQSYTSKIQHDYQQRGD